MGVITYNGISSDSLDIRVEKYPDYSTSKRQIEQISVPGRNGDLLLDMGSYSNFERSYDVYFNAKAYGFHDTAWKFAGWMLSARGYNRLEDSYDPDVFLMATVANQDVLRNWMNYMGRTTVTFNCKPQRWLKTGENVINLTDGDDVQNDYMPCYPIFSIVGNGTLSVNGNEVVISQNLNKVLTLDCETQNAYTNDENRNKDIRIVGEFPFLDSGLNHITFTNASVSMIPRYWRL